MVDLSPFSILLRQSCEADFVIGALGACYPGLDDPLVTPVVLRTLYLLKRLLIEARDINTLSACRIRDCC